MEDVGLPGTCSVLMGHNHKHYPFWEITSSQHTCNTQSQSVCIIYELPHSYKVIYHFLKLFSYLIILIDISVNTIQGLGMQLTSQEMCIGLPLSGLIPSQLHLAWDSLSPWLTVVPSQCHHTHLSCHHSSIHNSNQQIQEDFNTILCLYYLSSLQHNREK